MALNKNFSQTIMENLAISIFVVNGVVSFVVSSDFSVSPSVSCSVKFIPHQGAATAIPFEEFKAALGAAASSLSDAEIDHMRIIMDGLADVMFNAWKKKTIGNIINSPEKK